MRGRVLHEDIVPTCNTAFLYYLAHLYYNLACNTRVVIPIERAVYYMGLISLRVPDDVLERIDEKAGKGGRSAWMIAACLVALDDGEVEPEAPQVERSSFEELTAAEPAPVEEPVVEEKEPKLLHTPAEHRALRDAAVARVESPHREYVSFSKEQSAGRKNKRPKG